MGSRREGTQVGRGGDIKEKKRREEILKAWRAGTKASRLGQVRVGRGEGSRKRRGRTKGEGRRRKR